MADDMNMKKSDMKYLGEILDSYSIKSIVYEPDGDKYTFEYFKNEDAGDLSTIKKSIKGHELMS